MGISDGEWREWGLIGGTGAAMTADAVMTRVIVAVSIGGDSRRRHKDTQDQQAGEPPTDVSRSHACRLSGVHDQYKLRANDLYDALSSEILQINRRIAARSVRMPPFSRMRPSAREDDSLDIALL